MESIYEILSFYKGVLSSHPKLCLEIMLGIIFLASQYLLMTKNKKILRKTEREVRKGRKLAALRLRHDCVQMADLQPINVVYPSRRRKDKYRRRMFSSSTESSNTIIRKKNSPVHLGFNAARKSSSLVHKTWSSKVNRLLSVSISEYVRGYKEQFKKKPNRFLDQTPSELYEEAIRGGYETLGENHRNIPTKVDKTSSVTSIRTCTTYTIRAEDRMFNFYPGQENEGENIENGSMEKIYGRVDTYKLSQDTLDQISDITYNAESRTNLEPVN